MQVDWTPTELVALACRLGWTRATGGVRLVDLRGEHRIAVRQGDVIGFDLRDDEVKLGDVIQRLAGVDERQLARVLTRVRPGEPLGRLLVREGVVSDEVLQRALVLQAEMRLDELATREADQLRFV